MKIIRREKYLNKLINSIGTPDIKVITGVRRSGKSKLLEIFKKYIENNIKNNNIIHINFNIKKFDNLKDANKLYDYINKLYQKTKIILFFNLSIICIIIIDFPDLLIPTITSIKSDS